MATKRGSRKALPPTVDPREVERVATGACAVLQVAAAHFDEGVALTSKATFWRRDLLTIAQFVQPLREGAKLARVAAPYDALPGEPARSAWTNDRPSAVSAIAWLCEWWLTLPGRAEDDAELVDLAERMRDDLERRGTIGYLEARARKEVAQVLASAGKLGRKDKATAPKGPRNDVDDTTIAVLRREGRAVTFGDLERAVRSQVPHGAYMPETATYRKRLRRLADDGFISRDGTGLYWHPSIGPGPKGAD